MKITKLIAVAAAGAMAMASQSAMAADNATANATATFVDALDITKTTDLRFGSVIKPKVGNSEIYMGSDEVRVVQSGDAVLQTSTSGLASFTVIGGPGIAYNVQVKGTSGSANGVTLKGVHGICTGGTAGGTGLNTTNTGCTSYGAGGVKVGGSIEIAPSSTASGAVNVGTIKVTLAYQ